MSAGENPSLSRAVPWWRDLLLLTLAFGALYFFRLGSYPLSNPDEGRNAEVPREMIASGDWVTPRLNHVNYFEKPPLVYWVTAALQKAFGFNERTVRAVPALFAVLGVLGTYAAARALYGRTTGALAGVVLGTSLLWFVIGHIPILDTAMAVFMSGTLFFFLLATREAPGTRRRWLFMGLYVCAALATLTKGLIGFLVSGAVMFLWLLAFGQWRRLLPLYLPSGVLLFLAITVPWHVLAAMRNETWAHRYLVYEHFLRFLTPVASRPAPFHFFVWVVIGGLIPWTGFLWPTLREVVRAGWRRRKEHAETWFLLTWVAFIVFFFSISKSKLAPYVLPVFPALAVLVALELARGLTEGAVDRMRVGLRGLAVVCGLLGLAIVVVTVRPALVKMDAAQAAALRTPACFLAAVMLAGSAVIPWLGRRRGARAAITGIAAMMTGFYVTVAFAAPALHKPGTKDLALWVKTHAKPEDRVFHCYDFYQDFTFYAERFVGIIGSNVAELELSEDAAARASGRFISDTELLRQWPGPGRIFLVIQKKKIGQLKESYAAARAEWERRRAEAGQKGQTFTEQPPERPVFDDPGFQYHLIVETRAYYLVSNQP